VSASAGRSQNRLRRASADVATRFPWVVDAYRGVRNPRWALDLRRDLEEWRRCGAFLRELAPPAPDAPAVLVALYRDNVYETKVGLILASALRACGCRPFVSMPTNRTQRIRRYAEALGIADVIAQDTLKLSPAQLEECRIARERFLDGSLDFETIKDWQFRGQFVGTHVLSTLIRVTFDGSPDLEFEANRHRLSAILHDVLTNTVRAERILDDVAPRVVLVEEANYSINGPLVDVGVARDIDVVHTVGLWREDSLMSKRLTAATRRVDAQSVAPETLSWLGRTVWTAQADAELDADFEARYGGAWLLGQQFQPDTRPYRSEEIIAELGLDPTRPTAVIFAHVLWDASLFFGVDLFENYADWLVQSVGAAVANRNVNWVVKAHPSNVFRAAHGDVGGESSEVLLVREHFPALPDHVRLLLPETKISTLSLYRFADFGITVRGTPGMEIACFAKPAITAGTGAYSNLGFTYDSSSKAEYLERLAVIEQTPPMTAAMTERARRYAHALFVERPWPTRSFDLVFDFAEHGWHPTDRNVALRASSLEDIERCHDLGPWARWVLDSSEPDYVPGRDSASASNLESSDLDDQ